MAEIRVEEKRGMPAWIWILVLLGVALLAWFIYEAYAPKAEPIDTTAPVTTTIVPTPAPSTETTAPMPPSVSESVTSYVTMCDSPSTPVIDAASQHQYASQCFERLGASLRAITENQQTPATNLGESMVLLDQQLTSLKQSDPTQETYGAAMQQMVDASVQAMTAVQQAWYPSPPVEQALSDVRGTATLLKSKTTADERGQPLQQFFREAGDVLREMSASPTS